MALVTDKPEELTPQNDLDNVVDPDNPDNFDEKVDVYLSGARVCSLVNPPRGRGRITLMVELEGDEDGTKYNGNEDVPVWRCKRVGDMWRPGDPKPEPPEKKKTKKQQAEELAAAAAENQEPLLPYDDDADGEDQGVDDE
jgi:hypothetical protein